jgi:hypothetical protein
MGTASLLVVTAESPLAITVTQLADIKPCPDGKPDSRKNLLACARQAHESLALLESYEGRSAVGVGRKTATFENNIADME